MQFQSHRHRGLQVVKPGRDWRSGLPRRANPAPEHVATTSCSMPQYSPTCCTTALQAARTPRFVDVSPSLRAKLFSAPWDWMPTLPAAFKGGFRVRVHLQIIGGETREIPSDGQCHEWALDLNGRRMSTVFFWVESECDCFLRVSNRDSEGSASVLLPTQLDGGMPFLVLAHQPPVRVPPQRNPCCTSEKVSQGASKSYAIGLQRGALFEVSSHRPLYAKKVTVLQACLLSWLCHAGVRSHLQSSLQWGGWCSRARRVDL
jgi:hypothetical protein